MTSHRAAHAMEAYASRRRRRIALSGAEAAADAALAAGGALIANATLSLGFGLPSGRAGISLGISLVCAGFAWVTRHRGGATRHGHPTPVRAHAPRPILAPPITREARRAA